MGNSFFKRLLGKREVRILFLGLDASGKTTTLYRLRLGEVVTTIPTIGFNVETVNHKNVEITAWDIGVRDKMRPLVRHYYPNTQGIVYMVDSSDKERFDEVKIEIEGLFKEEELRGIPFLILANKQDLPDVITPEEIFENVKDQTTPDRKLAVFGVSATYDEKQQSGLIQAFDWLVDAMTDKEIENEIRKWMPLSGNSEEIVNKDKTVMEAVPGKEWTFMESLLETLKSMFYRAS